MSYLYKLISHSSHLEILKDNSTYSYSYTYNIYTLPLLNPCMRLLICITIDNGSNNTVGGPVTLLIKLIWSVAFIANARLELLYRGTLISRLNV